MSKRLILLGASGSIGSQTIDIIRKNPNDFSLVAVSVGNKVDVLDKLLSEFKSIKRAYIINPFFVKPLLEKYPNVTFYFGEEGLTHLVSDSDADMVVNALVGFAGLPPTIKAIEKGYDIALANKETLVVGGELINKMLKTSKSKIYPIDSEHAALRKCLDKVDINDVDKLILTASGGAFRDFPIVDLKYLKASEALKHPTWVMGNKITIDCATMMNKGFEIIEAHYLFNFPIEKIDILMHRESMIHSLVKLKDGSYVADIGKPDMHVPIEYALYECKKDYEVYHKDNYLDFNKDFHFFEFDKNRYPMVELAKYALDKKGLIPCILNASNEIAVNAYLKDKIGYLDIYKIVDHMIKNAPIENDNPTLEDYINCDSLTRILTKELIEKGGY